MWESPVYNNIQEIGSYNVFWHGKDKNGINAVSGIYFIKMSTEKKVQIQKVVLMK